jgi:hypothetical protein
MEFYSQAVGVILANIIPFETGYAAITDTYSIPIIFVQSAKRAFLKVDSTKLLRLTVYPRTNPQTGELTLFVCRTIADADSPHPSIKVNTFLIAGELVAKSKLRNQVTIKIVSQTKNVKPFALFIKGYFRAKLKSKQTVTAVISDRYLTIVPKPKLILNHAKREST